MNIFSNLRGKFTNLNQAAKFVAKRDKFDTQDTEGKAISISARKTFTTAFKRCFAIAIIPSMMAGSAIGVIAAIPAAIAAGPAAPIALPIGAAIGTLLGVGGATILSTFKGLKAVVALKEKATLAPKNPTIQAALVTPKNTPILSTATPK